jgi:hypothetical protein
VERDAELWADLDAGGPVYGGNRRTHQLQSDSRFHRIVMNPTFERGRDIEQVLRTYHSLRPGGIVAAIVSEGAFSRTDRKGAKFRDFLRTHEADTISLPPDSFKRSGTRVQCRMVRVRAR